MHHPGKVLRVFSPDDPDIISSDSSTEATISMWDENLITVLVNKNISSKIGEGDIVLVDYRPISATVPVPKMEVTKLLKGKSGEKTWTEYRDRHRALKGKQIPFISPPMQPPTQGYIG